MQRPDMNGDTLIESRERENWLSESRPWNPFLLFMLHYARVYTCVCIERSTHTHTLHFSAGWCVYVEKTSLAAFVFQTENDDVSSSEREVRLTHKTCNNGRKREREREIRLCDHEHVSLSSFPTERGQWQKLARATLRNAYTTCEFLLHFILCSIRI